jgi:hypothetical protein
MLYHYWSEIWREAPYQALKLCFTIIIILCGSIEIVWRGCSVKLLFISCVVPD